MHALRFASRPAIAAGALLVFTIAVLGASALAPAPAAATISDTDAWPAWTSTLSGVAGSFDMATDVKIGSTGAVYVCGYRGNAADNSEATLAKYVNGVLAWGPKAYDSAGGRADTAQALALGTGGAVYTVGSSSAAPGTADILLVKWSAKTGSVVWVKRYNGPAHKDDMGNHIVVDSHGNVIIAGGSAGADGMDDWVLRSYTPAGKVRWTWRSDWSDGVDAVHGLLAAGDGNAYVTGFADAAGPARATTIRLSATGKRLWARFYKGPDGLSASGDGITARPGGGVYICGYTRTTLNAHDGFVLSYTASGKRTVVALDSGPGGATDQGFSDLAVTATKHIVAVGYDKVGPNLRPHWAVYTPAGVFTSGGTVTSAASDSFAAVATDSFGGYYMAGTRCLAAGDRRLLTMRRSTLTGGGMWTFLSGSLPSDEVDLSAIAVRGSTAVIAGYAYAGAAADVDQVVAGFPY